jgi:hypothetical protein
VATRRRTPRPDDLVLRQAGFGPPAVPHHMPHAPRSPLPRARPRDRHRAAPACTRQRWNIAAAPAASMEHCCCFPEEEGWPRGRRSEAGGARAADGAHGPGPPQGWTPHRATAGVDTAPGYRRDSLLTEGSGQGKRNLRDDGQQTERRRCSACSVGAAWALDVCGSHIRRWLGRRRNELRWELWPGALVID